MLKFRQIQAGVARGVLCVGLLAAIPVQAAAIRNLSGVQQTIEIATSDGYDARVIEPGERFVITGDVRIRYHEKEWRIEFDKEYAIWPGDIMGPQKRMNRASH